MSLAVAAAALDRALKGTAPTMHPPQLPPQSLHLHRKSYSAFRKNSSSYVPSVSPGQRQIRSLCEDIRPQPKYINEQNGSGCRKNSERSNAEKICAARRPLFETRIDQTIQKNSPHIEVRKSANALVGPWQNKDGHQSCRIDTTECTDKFYSIPRFPFRGMSFTEKFTYPHRSFKIRSTSLDSPPYGNECVGQWKNERGNFCRGLHAWNDSHEMRRKLGPPNSYRKSFINSSRKKNSSSAEREKGKGNTTNFDRMPSCTLQIHCNHTGKGVVQNSNNFKVATCRTISSGEEKSSSQNLGIESSKGVEQSLDIDELKTTADKSDFKTNNETSSVKPEEVSENTRGSTDENSGILLGREVNAETGEFIYNSSADMEVTDGVDEGSSKDLADELVNLSLDGIKSEKRLPKAHNNKSASLAYDSDGMVHSLGWENGASSYRLGPGGLGSSEKSNLEGTFADIKGTNNEPDILEFRSICEERNGSIVVKPDIASKILKECLSSNEVVECSKSDHWATINALRLEVTDNESIDTRCGQTREMRNLSEEQSNLMFDFIYHSETEGFKSSSPKKQDCFTHRRSFDEDESDNTVVPEKRSGRRTESILSLIKSSRKKLLAAGTNKRENVTNLDFSEGRKFQSSGEVDSKESPILGEKGQVEMPDSKCLTSIFRNSYDSVTENPKAINEMEKKRQSKNEPCVLSVSLDEIGPFMTRWRSFEPKSSSNFREEFQSYHNCEKFHSQESKYKTELCRAFQIRGSCRYGSRCNYAHGLDQLKVSFHHGKYKTRNCQAYHESGYCRYGARCSFIHDLEEGILKCSIANKEILEALHHWPEEETAVDRSATVTWRVFTGCSNSGHNETMLEFAAIPSLKPADIASHSPGTTESRHRIRSLGAGQRSKHVEDSQPRNGTRSWIVGPDSLHAEDTSEPANSQKSEPHCDDNSQKQFFECDFANRQNGCTGRSPLIKNNVNDLLTLLRSVETESFAIHRAYSQTNGDLNQSQEMRIVSRFPCSIQNDQFSRHDFYNCRARVSRQRCGNYINLLNEESPGDLDHSRSEILKKGKKCFSFHQKGFCLYGPNCLFIHDE